MWLTNALKVLVYSAVVSFAVFGLASSMTVVGLATGHVTTDHVMSFVTQVQNLGAAIAGLSGSGIVGIFARYGIPAFLAFRREERDRAREELIAAVAKAIGKK